MHKTPAEVERVRKAAQTADEAYVIFREAAREGPAAVRSRRRNRIVAARARRRRQLHADRLGRARTSAASRRPRTASSPKGDNVITELTPSIEGYYAQICRTLVVGKASDAQKRALRRSTSKRSKPASRRCVPARSPPTSRAPRTTSSASTDMGEYVTSAYTRVRGHGSGLFADSKPHILEDVDTELRPGMTFVVHPNTYNPNVGYMMLGDSVGVTADRVRGLHRRRRACSSTERVDAPRTDRVVEDRTARERLRCAHRRDAQGDGGGQDRHAGRVHELHAAVGGVVAVFDSSRTGRSARWCCRKAGR